MAEGGECEESREIAIEMEGVASIALLPSGNISGHFIRIPHSTCFGLLGTEMACERECSRGEDYRLINLNIIEFSTKREETVVVECKGHDAARFHNVDHLHGWETNVVKEVEQKQTKSKIRVSFECESLKADKAAEDHIIQFMPKLIGMEAVVNVGKMTISGWDFEEEEREQVEEEQVEQEPIEQEQVEEEPTEQEQVEQEPIEQEQVERKAVEQGLVEQEPVEKKQIEQGQEELVEIEQSERGYGDWGEDTQESCCL